MTAEMPGATTENNSVKKETSFNTQNNYVWFGATFSSRAHMRRMGFPAICGPVADAPGAQNFLCCKCGTRGPLELLV